MASYYFTLRQVKRSEGRSAVAAAAYRSAERLRDERQGRTWDYTRKERVTHTEILAPADAPEWTKNRERLWNQVETAEKRKDSQLAREILLALPEELDHEKRLELTRAFVTEQFVSKGMVADLAIHETETGNPHAHVMLTMRSIGPDGFGQKERAWNQKPLANEWREEWAVAQNLALARAGCLSRVDHRSFAARGIAIAPTRHLGPAAHHDDFGLAANHKAILRQRAKDVIADPKSALWIIAEKKPQFTERDISEWVAANVDAESADSVKRAILGSDELCLATQGRTWGEKTYTTRYEIERAEVAKEILNDPAAALMVFAQTHATFTERDLDRYLLQHTDPASFLKVKAAVMATPELLSLGSGRFTTRTELINELQLVRCADTLASNNKHKVDSKQIIQASLARRMGLEQELAFRHIVAGRGDIAVVQGYAGAGKSYMLGAAREVWEASGYQVRGAALAGKAADGLQADAKIQSRTLASWELAWSQGRDTLTAKDILVVDEAGMVGVAQLGRVMEKARIAGAKVVLVGDTQQLHAIDAGGGMQIVAERVGQAFITEVRRQKVEWMQHASREMGLGNCVAGLKAYHEHGHLKGHETTEDAVRAVVEAWNKIRVEKPGASQLMLAYQHIHVDAMNALARAHMRESGDLGADHQIKTANGERSFAAGDRVYFLKNDRRLAVKNGTLGTVLEITGGQISVRLDGDDGKVVRFDPRTYGHVDYGYAATVHKSQGATVDHAHVLASKLFTSNVSYVAMSRHRHDVTLHWDRQTFGSEQELIASIGRANTLRNAIDFLAGHLPTKVISAEHLEREEHRRRDVLTALSGEELRARLAKAKEIAERPLKARNTELDADSKIIHANAALVAAEEARHRVEAEFTQARHAYACGRVCEAHAEVLRTAAAWEQYKSSDPVLVFRGDPVSARGEQVLVAYLRAFSKREDALTVCQKHNVVFDEATKAIYAQREQDLAAIKSGQGLAPTHLKATLQVRQAGKADKAIAKAMDDYARPSGVAGAFLRMKKEALVEATRERERAIRALMKLRGDASLNRQAQRTVDKRNASVRQAQAHVVEIKTVIVERKLLVAERQHCEAATKWLGLARNVPNSSKLAREYVDAVKIEKAGGRLAADVLGRNYALAKHACELREAERAATKEVFALQCKLRALDGRVTQAKTERYEGQPTPVQLRQAMLDHANAAKAWVRYAEQHPDQVWAARRGESRGEADGARCFEAYVRAAQSRAEMAALFARQRREKEIGDIQAKIDELEPQYLMALRPRGSAEASKEAELERQLNNERRRLQQMVDPERVRPKPPHVREDIGVIAAKVEATKSQAYGTAHAWQLVKSELPQEMISEARCGRGPAADIYARAYAAQHEYHYAKKQHATELQLLAKDKERGLAQAADAKAAEKERQQPHGVKVAEDKDKVIDHAAVQEVAKPAMSERQAIEHELGKLEVRHLRAQREFAAHRAENPDAMRAPAGSPAAKLKKAEHLAAEEMARVARKLDGLRPGLVITPPAASAAAKPELGTRYLKACEAFEKAAEQWSRYKRENEARPELVHVARAGEGEGGKVYVRYREAFEARCQAIRDLAQRIEREQRLMAQRRELDERWANAKPADPAHPYLTKMGVQAFDLRQDTAGNLLVPLRDKGGRLCDIQQITPSGDNRLSIGARGAPGFHVLGDLKGAKDIMVCGGYATGATLHQASGKPVVIAVDADSLKSVALAVRQTHEKAKIYVMADDDRQRIPNVGREKAKEAAQAVKGRMVLPQFAPREIAAGAINWNDLYKSRGLRTVQAQLNNMIFKRDMGMQL